MTTKRETARVTVTPRCCRIGRAVQGRPLAVAAGPSHTRGGPSRASARRSFRHHRYRPSQLYRAHRQGQRRHLAALSLSGHAGQRRSKPRPALVEVQLPGPPVTAAIRPTDCPWPAPGFHQAHPHQHAR
jgi:hypothetical protein